jgi:hypothetical protein
MILLIMHFSPAFSRFIPLRSKYSARHPVLKRRQSMFLPECQRSSFTPLQNYRQHCSFVHFNRLRL